MIENHPITPPPELVREWAQVNGEKDLERFWTRLATQAARWGADQELEACCEILRGEFNYHHLARPLRAARRPKPPSLAEQGCDALDTYIYGNPDHKDKERTYNTIRAALDRLKELEQSND